MPERILTEKTEDSSSAPQESWDALTYYKAALSWVEKHQPDNLYWVRNPSKVDKTLFFREYVWVVLVGGFRASIASRIYPKLIEALQNGASKEELLKIFNNNKKISALLACDIMLKTTPWDEFKERYLSSIDAMEQLPHIGPVTKNHLARNIGMDAVKPDRWLIRLAKFFNFDSPMVLCYFIKANGLSNSLGEADLVFFTFTQHHKPRFLLDKSLENAILPKRAKYAAEATEA